MKKIVNVSLFLVLFISIFFGLQKPNLNQLEFELFWEVISMFLHASEEIVPAVNASIDTRFFQFEDSWYPEYDSAVIAWKDSYILDALLDLYEITNDKSYLALFEERAVEIIDSLITNTNGLLLSARYTSEVFSPRNEEAILKGIHLDGGNLSFDDGRLMVVLDNDGELFIDVSALSLKRGERFVIKFEFKGEEGSCARVINNGHHFTIQSNNKDYFIPNKFFCEFIFNDQQNFRIRSEGLFVLKNISMKQYSEYPVHYGVFLKVLIKGLLLGASVNEQYVNNSLNKVNDKYFHGEGSFFGLFTRKELVNVLNQTTALATANLRWSLYMNDPRSLEIAMIIANNLKQNILKISDMTGGYIWPYSVYLNESAPISDRSRMEDISHGNLIVDFMNECYENNMVFRKEDMERLAITFHEHVWSGDSEDVQFNRFIDGTGGFSDYWPREWTLLSEFKPELLDIVRKYIYQNRNHFLKDSFMNTTHSRWVIVITKYLLIKRKLLESNKI